MEAGTSGETDDIKGAVVEQAQQRTPEPRGHFTSNAHAHKL